MLSKTNLEKLTKSQQTSIENIVREYCQHLFLSCLYQLSGSEKLLFKGGTALRILCQSPRFSEDLDFTGLNITQREVEKLFANTLAAIERIGIRVEITECKPTTGGYLGIASFYVFEVEVQIQIEVSLRSKKIEATKSLVENNYIPAYIIVHLPMEQIIKEKLEALFARSKPRDFYDYFFLLSGNYPIVKSRENLEKVLALVRREEINFKTELKKFLPASYVMHLRDFKKILEQKILTYLG